MKTLPKLLRELRGKQSLREVSNRAGISHNYLSQLEKGIDPRTGKEIKPSPETLKRLSEAYNYDYKELMKIAGYIEESKEKNHEKLPELTPKDERDIAKQLEKILEAMDSDTALAFDGEPMDEETKELVRAAIESNLQLAKQIAKKKFTPNKYRKDKE